MSFLNKIKPSMIIHGFALLHAGVALACRLAGVGDELFLTILTMAMLLAICYKKKLSIEFTAALTIAGNIIGYLMGTMGASILENIFTSPLLIHALSTAVTTEVLGWSIVGIAKIFRHNSSDGNALSSSYMRWILLAASGVFVIRLLIVTLFIKESFDTDFVLSMIGKVISNSVGIVFLICLNILYIRYFGKEGNDIAKWKKHMIAICFTFVATLIEILIVKLGSPLGMQLPEDGNGMLLFIIAFLTQVTIYCIIYIVNYALTSRQEMQRQKEKAHLAQYRYLKLKRQVDPHFLFNCLNILDCLVCEEKTEQASTYIHKLAGIYRYMLKSEDEDLVQVRDELVFVQLYIDLLKVRFPEGFEVEIDVKEEHMARYMLPCSLQLLIENATKHNAVTPEKPLKINIVSTEDSICVSNVMIPKVTKAQSAGVGHKYLTKLYFDLSGKEIEIKDDNETYSVTLPLL